MFDHDSQPARTDDERENGHLTRRLTQGHDVQRALRAQRAGRASCVDRREQRQSSKMMCDTSWGVPESKRASYPCVLQALTPTCSKKQPLPPCQS